MNAVGVMARIETNPQLLARRFELAAKIAAQLHDSLNTVVPVLTGLRCALDRFSGDGVDSLRRLVEALRRVPPGRLTLMLDNPAFFREREYPDCPLTPDERRALVGGLPWGVFATLARVVNDRALGVGAALEQLNELASLDPLKRTLQENFFQRGRLLRCHRILADARRILAQIKVTYLPTLRRQDRAEQQKLERFRAFIREADGDGEVAAELTEFVTRQLSLADRAGQIEALHAALDYELSGLFHELEEHNADYEALRLLESQAASFSAAELAELRSLFGLYGIEAEKRLAGAAADGEVVRQRQIAWRQVALASPPGIARHAVAERAHACYGLLLEAAPSRRWHPALSE
jgi:hypothetical protein